MIYGFYFRFFKLTKNKYLSVLLSKLAYFLYVCKFLIRKTVIKKKNVEMSQEEAIKRVSSAYPDPGKRPTYNNPSIDLDVDLSIVVPVYNYVSLIRDNIESVLNQSTSFNYELILVDDGSTDGAREVVLEYMSHPRVKVILQENKGIAGARNTGIDHAVGKYLMFIDCDDLIHKDMIQVLLTKAFEQDYDIVMCAHNLSKEKDGIVYSVIPNVYPDMNLLNYKNNDEIMNFAGLPWCKVYKRQLWNKVRFFPGYWYEDSIIHFLLFTQCKKFSYIPKVEYEYKWYENNFSHIQNNRKSIRAIDRYWLLLAILDQYDEMNLPKDERLYTLVLKHVSAYYYSTIKGLDEDIVDAMFVLASNLLNKYRLQKKVELPFVLRYTEKALLERDINLWKLASEYQ